VSSQKQSDKPGPPRSPFQKGQVLFGKYTILEILLSSNSIVYKAIDNSNSQTVAVKQVSLQGGDWERWRLVHREFYAGMNLNHPNLTRYHGSYENEAGFFIVRDWAEGESLHDFLKNGVHFTEHQMVSIISHVLNAVAYLHSFPRPIIHRDITPTNIVINIQDRNILGVKLIDLDAVANLRDPDSDAHQTMTLSIGTRGYLAPEAIFAPCTQSDLFSIGAVMLRMYTNQNADAVYDYRRLAFRKRPVVLKEIGDSRLKEFLKRSLAPLEERFQSAADMKKALPSYSIEKIEVSEQIELSEKMMQRYETEELLLDKICRSFSLDGESVSAFISGGGLIIGASTALTFTCWALFWKGTHVLVAVGGGIFIGAVGILAGTMAGLLGLVSPYFILGKSIKFVREVYRRESIKSAVDLAYHNLLTGRITDQGAQEKLASLISHAWEDQIGGEPARIGSPRKLRKLLSSGVLTSDKAEETLVPLVEKPKHAQKLLESRNIHSFDARVTLAAKIPDYAESEKVLADSPPAGLLEPLEKKEE